MPGVPVGPSPVESARAMLQRIDEGFTRDAAATTFVLDTLASSLQRDGWSRLYSEEVRVLREEFKRAFGASLRLENRTSQVEDGRRVRYSLKGKKLEAWLRRDRARIDVRIADPTAGPDTQRQRSALSVAWALRAVQAWRARQSADC